jgi:hypothetical protein
VPRHLYHLGFRLQGLEILTAHLEQMLVIARFEKKSPAAPTRPCPTGI